MTEAQEQKAERIAAIAAIAIGAILLLQAAITGQPINDPCGELHGQSRTTCAEAQK